MTYVAPARYLYRLAHRLDPHRPADAPTFDGYTVCGLPLLADELWLPVAEPDVGFVCLTCRNPDTPSAEELTLL